MPPATPQTRRRPAASATPRRAIPPLVLLQHFRGNLDNWDPLLLDALAATREVIPVENAGVGLSSGTVLRTITAMTRDAITFTDALGLTLRGSNIRCGSVTCALS
jgi:pimeloyl-ACP methyl ester carboxylesterase